MMVNDQTPLNSGQGTNGSGLRHAALNRFDRIVFGTMDALAAITLMAMILIALAIIFIRAILHLSFPALDDVVRYCMIWSVYLGVIVISRNNDHISVEVLYSRFPPVVKRVVDRLIGLNGIALCGYSAYLGWSMTVRAIEQGQLSLSTHLPAWTGYIVIPISFGLSALGFFIVTLTGRSERRDTIDTI